MSSKSNFNYKSLIKVHGCSLLPPVIDCNLRKEIIKYKQDAIALENELSLKKISESERFSVHSNDTTNQSIDLDGCSEGTIKLIEYIKKALKDVAHDTNVEQLQDQFFEDLKKFECAKAIAELSKTSSSCDTLHNLETFNTELEDAKGCNSQNEFDNHSNTSSDAETLSPENPHPEKVVLFDQLKDPPSSTKISTPIRRKSFTLESPSPALVRYFQSISKDTNSEPIDINSRDSVKRKSSKNLNELWNNDTNFDMTAMTQAPSHFSASPKDKQIDNRITNHCQNINNISCDHAYESTGTTKVSSSEQFNSSPKRNGLYSSEISGLNEMRAAAKIQAGIRGYLTRRLFRTNKVIDLKKIICDSVVCAKKLHMEESVTQADVTLHVRLIRQVTAACFELHSIFFEWPIKEQMALIRQDRVMTIRALERRSRLPSDLMSKSEIKMSPVTRQHISPHSGSLSHGSIMSASFPQDKSSPTYLRLSKGCPTPS